MTTKIKKGTEVWQFRSWDNKAAAYARRLIVQSFGKVQGTATAASSGDFILVRLHAPYNGIVAVADVDNVAQYGLEWAKADHAERIRKQEAHIEWCLERERQGLPHAYDVNRLQQINTDLRKLVPSFFVKEA